MSLQAAKIVVGAVLLLLLVVVVVAVVVEVVVIVIVVVLTVVVVSRKTLRTLVNAFHCLTLPSHHVLLGNINIVT